MPNNTGPAQALKRSRDRKVAPKAYRYRRGWAASIANSFGLPPITSCPGRTPFCEVCYVLPLQASWQYISEALERNHEVLREALIGCRMAYLLDKMMEGYVRELANKGIQWPRDYFFRPHWSGDFDSLEAAEAWRWIIEKYWWIRFLVYTRSFLEHGPNVIPILAENKPKNLQLFISVDRWNLERAKEIIREYPNVRAAPSTREGRSEAVRIAEEVAPDRRWVVCPESFGEMPLVSDEGRGACADCRICLVGTRTVLFKDTDQYGRDTGCTVGQLALGLESQHGPCGNCGTALFQNGEGELPSPYCSLECEWDATGRLLIPQRP